MCSAKTSIYVTNCVNWTFKRESVCFIPSIVTDDKQKNHFAEFSFLPKGTDRRKLSFTRSLITLPTDGMENGVVPVFVNLFSSREKAVCKKLLKTIEDTLHDIFEEESLIFSLSHNYYTSV